MSEFSLAIHGGAGTILPEHLTPALELAYKKALDTALDAGWSILSKGATALDAVEAAVRSLEDEPLFNAGRGSVFAHDGRQEMDASIMEGSGKMAGAVSAVRNIRNPVSLARAVMEQTEHVYLTGQGAMDFAQSLQLPTEPDAYFYTDHRYEQLQALQRSGGTALDHDVPGSEKKFGTVGAVACDRNGHLAAATSTGGMTNKKWGRVGDSPIIGAGTYANDQTCAISCTGHGEYFLRAVVAYDVSCLMEYRGYTLQQAMDEVLFKKLKPIGGEGGMIGVDAQANTALLFNSAGMYRAVVHSNGRRELAIFGS